MKWNLTEIKKFKSIHFNEKLSLKDELIARNKNILDLTEVKVSGTVSFENGYYNLFFVASYVITLPSTRSLTPVCLTESISIHEVFVSADMKIELTDEYVLTIENGELLLDEAVADNILLEIPTQILTEDEKKADTQLPSGKNWKVISEEDYAVLRKEKKKEESAFGKIADFLE